EECTGAKFDLSCNQSNITTELPPFLISDSVGRLENPQTMNRQEMTARIARGDGFIAALDQSGGSTPKALRAYGVADEEWNGEEEMFARIHEMRSRIIRSPAFSGDKVVGAILFEKTMDGAVDGAPVSEALIDKGVVPFLKIDKGLEDEANGVQLMKPIPDLDALLDRAKSLGVFGTKERSVINSDDRQGIADIVAQQFELGRRVLEHDMMPILEPEYSIKADGRTEGEVILRDEILTHLEALPEERQVMPKLSLPVEPDLFRPVVEHPRVLKVVALS